MGGLPNCSLIDLDAWMPFMQKMDAVPGLRVCVVGAGLAGAACAHVLAQQGFLVDLIEQGATPAAAASGVPLAMFAPSVSADDAPHSRLLRSGVNLLVSELERLSGLGLLVAQKDWQMSGVQERCVRAQKHLPPIWTAPIDMALLQSRYFLPHASAQLTGAHRPLWHGAAGWVKPERLIAAWVQHPRIKLKLSTGLSSGHLQKMLAEETISAVVLATGQSTGGVVSDLFAASKPELAHVLGTRLQSIRGQVEWGVRGHLCDALVTQMNHSARPSSMVSNRVDPSMQLASTTAINGMGHWLSTTDRWLAGATFQRDDESLTVRSKDRLKNLEKLCTLLPELEQAAVGALFATSRSWVGLRAAQKNRQPWVDQICESVHPKLWVCAGLGSRGLSLSLLCAQRLVQKIQTVHAN
jgi:tRNA 5-methylaminomethyl-2-thiouridine biosynthesis bifunctional protein